METYDVIILGAGASGMCCALQCVARGRTTLVLEHNPRAGTKLRVSGGGHCNFSNREVRAEHYLSGNPHFCKSAIARFTQTDALAMIKALGLDYEERDHGRLFLTQPVGVLADRLEQALARNGATCLFSHKIAGVERGQDFLVRANGRQFRSTSLVVATGGMSYPSLGATDLGYRLARQFGLTVIPPQPGLAPLRYNESASWMAELSGISIMARAWNRRASFTEDLLFTHKGLSGPAILQLSSYLQNGDLYWIDFMPTTKLDREFERCKQEQPRLHVMNLLHAWLPKRLAERLIPPAIGAKKLAETSRGDLGRLTDSIHAREMTYHQNLGYDKAEVTLGGVSTATLSSKSMAAKQAPGLYFIGEVVDVTGQLGGYNLQWAWSSGYAAGQEA